MLHLCNKAGRLVFGREAVLSLSAKGELFLVLLASDAGADLRRKLSGYKIANLKWSSDELGGLFGRKLLSVTGVKDKSFADEIERLLDAKQLGEKLV